MLKEPLFPATKEGLLRHSEYLYLEEVLAKFPDGLVAYVADSYDYFGFLTQILPLAKDTIMSRNGKLVVRGDSGDPVDIICGIKVPDYSVAVTLDLAASYAFSSSFNFSDKLTSTLVESIFSYKDKIYKTVYAVELDSFDKVKNYTQESLIEYTLTPEEKGTIEILWDLFGGTTNDLGYKTLDSHIGMIYGDGITMERAQEIFTRLQNKGFASLNIVFGIGAYSLAAMLSRDDLGIAVKATSATVSDGNETRSIPVYKEPKTDSSKKSAKGLLKVTYDADTKLYVLHNNVSEEESREGELKTVFLNGNFTDIVSFTDIKTELYS